MKIYKPTQLYKVLVEVSHCTNTFYAYRKFVDRCHMQAARCVDKLWRRVHDIYKDKYISSLVCLIFVIEHGP
jgi:hypothetical protein